MRHLRFISAILLLAAGGAAASAGAAWLARARIASWALSRATGHDVRVADVRAGRWGLGLDSLEVRMADGGAPFVRVGRVDVIGSWRGLLRRRAVRVRIVQPAVEAARRPDGRWNVVALLGLDETGPPAFEVREVVVEDGVVSAPFRLRAAAIRARIAGDLRRVAVAFRLEPPPAPGLPVEALGALDLRVRALRTAGGWRLETASVAATGSDLRLAGRADAGETSIRLAVVDLRVGGDLIRAVSPAWPGGSIESDSLVLEASLDGAWSASGRLRSAGYALVGAGRGRFLEGTAAGTVAGPGLRARWSASVGEGAWRVALEGARLDGPALGRLATAAGLAAPDRGRLIGSAAASFSAGTWTARAAAEAEELRIVVAGRRLDLLYDTLAVEARGRAGAVAFDATANVEDAAFLRVGGVVPADAPPDLAFDVDVRRPGEVADLLDLPVRAPAGRLRLEGRLSGREIEGVFGVDGLALSHETSSVSARGIGVALPFRARLPADAARWADLLAGLSFPPSDLTVGTLAYDIYRADEIRARIAAETGTITVRDATFGLYGGRGRWLRDASYREADGRFEVALEVEGIDLGRFSEDLRRAHEAFRPPRIPAGHLPLAGRISGRAIIIGDKTGFTTFDLTFENAAGEEVAVHNSIGRALYDMFGAPAVEAAAAAAEASLQAAVERAVEAARARGFAVVDTPAVEIRPEDRIAERIEQRYAEEAYTHYAEAFVSYFADIARPTKRLRLHLVEGGDAEHDVINYRLSIEIPKDRDPFRILGTLVAGEMPKFDYEWRYEE